MKQIIKLTIILSLFAQAGYAQKVETEEEYRAYNDSIICLLKIAKKDANNFVGKPFSELVKHFEKCGLKITLLSISEYDNQKTFPQHVYGISVRFISKEIEKLMWIHDLFTPEVYISFEGSKPYEKALSLFEKEEGVTFTNRGPFTKEVEEFYSDAVTKAIKFGFMDRQIYAPRYKRLPLTKAEAEAETKSLQER